MEDIIDSLANKDLRVVGIKQVLKCLDKGEVRCVILAKDADECYKKCVLDSAKDKGVKVVRVESKDILASYCKVDTPTAVAGLK